MVKLIIFFRQPADVDAFEEHFANRHVPLIGAMPNVVRSAVTRAIGAPRGEPPYYLIHDVYFADLPALTFALNSAPGRAAGADLMTFARDVVTLMYAEVWGEDPFELGLGAGSEPAPEAADAEADVPVAAATVAPDSEVKPGLTPINIGFLENPPAAATAAEAAAAPEAVAEADVAGEGEAVSSASASAPEAEVAPEAVSSTSTSTSTSTAEDGVTPSDTQDPADPRPQPPSSGATPA